MHSGACRLRHGAARIPAVIIGLGLVIGLTGPAAGGDLATNNGGVLLLNVQSDDPWEPGAPDICTTFRLQSGQDARTRLHADGAPHLVTLYAQFPPDSAARISAVSFGIRYSESVKVWGSAPCNSDGFQQPMDNWPASEGGTAVVFRPPAAASGGGPVPIYWFALSARSPGFFEVMPCPSQDFGGRFGNDAVVPAYLAPISGYGRVGFDLDGVTPVPGSPAVTGACCTEKCRNSSDVECSYYRGIFLGPDTNCENEPCGDYAIKGACCLDGRCEMRTLLDCARRGGTALREGARCDTVHCPSPAARSDSLAPTQGKGLHP